MEQFVLSHGSDSILEQGKRVRNPPHEKEGTEKTCDGQTTTPILHSTVPIKDEKGQIEK